MPTFAAQFKDYLTRAEYLKGVVNQDNTSGPEQGNSAASAQKVKKPGAKDDVSNGADSHACSTLSNLGNGITTHGITRVVRR